MNLQLLELGDLKFDLEKRIESIEHQLTMSAHRKELGEEIDYTWVNKAKFKLNMLKIELKQINLKFDYFKKENDKIQRIEREKERLCNTVRLEREFLNIVKEQYGEEFFLSILNKAKERI